jgi:SMODS and SLOG-associating 2TM effector domain family 4
VTPEITTILACARELYGRVVYSHKVHEVERELCSKTVFWMNVTNILLAAATTVFAVIAASLKPDWAMIVTAILAAASICFVVWQASFDPARRESEQRIAAKELLWIREQFLLLIQGCHAPTAVPDQLQHCLESLNMQLSAAYKFVPNTSAKAYEIASKRLKGGQFTFSDDEIDEFLPTELRKKKF